MHIYTCTLAKFMRFICMPLCAHACFMCMQQLVSCSHTYISCDPIELPWSCFGQDLIVRDLRDRLDWCTTNPCTMS